MSRRVSIWTDGACSGNPGPGGWGAVLRYGGHEKELKGGEAFTTNNRMELMAVIVGLLAWPLSARVIRSQTLSLRERLFVQVAKLSGENDFEIITRQILPNLTAPIIVYATLQIPTNILIEAALSFLGVGIRPPTASWGQMIASATPIFNTAWWYMVFPGAALLLTVLAFNLLGDGLRDALNPKSA